MKDKKHPGIMLELSKGNMVFDKLYDRFTDMEKKTFMKSFLEEVNIYEAEQEDGRILRSLKFRFPVFFNNHELYELDWDNESTVESVCVLSRIDDDNNGFVDDTIGWNFVENTNEVLTGKEYYENDHGTEIASIISSGSSWSEFKGITYNDNVEIMSIKILSGIEREGSVENLTRI